MAGNINEDRKKILQMVSDGKISVEEASMLIEALGGGSGQTSPLNIQTESSEVKKSAPRFFKVSVNPPDGEDGEKVNVRIPLALIKAGVNFASLTSMIPKDARGDIEGALGEQGIDLSQIKPENVDELINALGDFNVDVVADDGKKVRVYCE